LRRKTNPQRSIFELFSDHSIGRELKAISDRLERHPEFLDWVLEDLQPTQVDPTGRRGMTVETIFRAAILKQHTGFSYRELAFYLDDSRTFQAFVRLDRWAPSESALHSGISAISWKTWEKIHRSLVREAANQGVERGRMTRTDSTVMESNIHEPSDSSLLWDGVRVMTRLLQEGQGLFQAFVVPHRNHCRAVKRIARNLEGLGNKKKRPRLYRRLLRYTQNTCAYLITALRRIEPEDRVTSPQHQAWCEESRHFLQLTQRVMDQTQRRVFDGEKVPAREKIVSIFEEHTDIIVKGSRKVEYGHKVNLTSGKTGLIIDLVIEDGNPSDAATTIPMIERQIDIYGRPPRQVSFDGGYASKDNLLKAKELGVKDVAFHKKRGIRVEAMVKSTWVYRKLRDFRAGIEGNISCLKRHFGLERCSWTGWRRFKAYAWGSVVAYNLVLLARIELAATLTC
jgi:IS5 family transposase